MSILDTLANIWDNIKQNVSNAMSQTYDTSNVDWGGGTGNAPTQERQTVNPIQERYDTTQYDYGGYTSPTPTPSYTPTYNDYVGAYSGGGSSGGGSSASSYEDYPTIGSSPSQNRQMTEAEKREIDRQIREKAVLDRLQDTDRMREESSQAAMEKAKAQIKNQIPVLNYFSKDNWLQGSDAYENGTGKTWLDDAAYTAGAGLIDTAVNDIYALANTKTWNEENAGKRWGPLGILGTAEMTNPYHHTDAELEELGVRKLTGEELKNSQLTNSMLQKQQEWRDRSALTGSKLGELGESVGAQAFNPILGMLGGEGLTLGAMGLSSLGAASEQALQNGADINQAMLYGLLNAGKEIGTEKLSPGIPGVNMEVGLGSLLGEGMEEAIGTYLDPFVDIALQDNSSFDKFLGNLGAAARSDLTLNRLGEAADAFAMGAASAGIMGGAGNVANAVAHPVYTAEGIADTLTGSNRYANDVKGINDDISMYEDIAKTSTGIEKETAEQKAQENRDRKRVYQRMYATAENLRNGDGQTKKAAQAANAELIRDTAKEAGANLSDSQITNIAKIANKAGVAVEFTKDGIDFNGAKVDGLQTDDGRILINANASDPIATIFAHEITHATQGTSEYKSLRNTLTSMANAGQVSTDGVDAIRNSDLTNEQKQNEITAVLAQNILGNDTSINHLANRDMNLLRYMYERITNYSDAKESAVIKAERAMQKAIKNAEVTNLKDSNAYNFPGMSPMDAVEKVVKSRNSEGAGQFSTVIDPLSGDEMTLYELANSYEASGDTDVANFIRTGSAKELQEMFGEDGYTKKTKPRTLAEPSRQIEGTLKELSKDVHKDIDELFESLNNNGYLVYTAEEFNESFIPKEGSELGDGLYVAVPEWETVKQPNNGYGAIGVFTVANTDGGVKIDRSIADIVPLEDMEAELGERPKQKRSRSKNKSDAPSKPKSIVETITEWMNMTPTRDNPRPRFEYNEDITRKSKEYYEAINAISDKALSIQKDAESIADYDVVEKAILEWNRTHPNAEIQAGEEEDGFYIEDNKFYFNGLSESSESNNSLAEEDTNVTEEKTESEGKNEISDVEQKKYPLVPAETSNDITQSEQELYDSLMSQPVQNAVRETMDNTSEDTRDISNSDNQFLQSMFNQINDEVNAGDIYPTSTPLEAVYGQDSVRDAIFNPRRLSIEDPATQTALMNTLPSASAEPVETPKQEEKPVEVFQQAKKAVEPKAPKTSSNGKYTVGNTVQTTMGEGTITDIETFKNGERITVRFDTVDDEGNPDFYYDDFTPKQLEKKLAPDSEKANAVKVDKDVKLEAPKQETPTQETVTEVAEEPQESTFPKTGDRAHLKDGSRGMVVVNKDGTLSVVKDNLEVLNFTKEEFESGDAFTVKNERNFDGDPRFKEGTIYFNKDGDSLRFFRPENGALYAELRPSGKDWSPDRLPMPINDKETLDSIISEYTLTENPTPGGALKALTTENFDDGRLYYNRKGDMITAEWSKDGKKIIVTETPKGGSASKGVPYTQEEFSKRYREYKYQDFPVEKNDRAKQENKAINVDKKGNVNIDKEAAANLTKQATSNDPKERQAATDNLAGNIKAAMPDTPSSEAASKELAKSATEAMFKDKTFNQKFYEEHKEELDKRFAEQAKKAQQAEAEEDYDFDEGINTEVKRGNDPENAKKLKSKIKADAKKGGTRGQHVVKHTNWVFDNVSDWYETMGHDLAEEYLLQKPTSGNTELDQLDNARAQHWMTENRNEKLKFMKENGITAEKGNYYKDGQKLDLRTGIGKQLNEYNLRNQKMMEKADAFRGRPAQAMRFDQMYMNDPTVPNTNKRAVLNAQIEVENERIKRLWPKQVAKGDIKLIDKISDAEWDAYEQAEGDAQKAELEKIYKRIGEAIPATAAERVRAWRYLMMLANPMTHFRNLVGNGAMQFITDYKDAVAVLVEAGVKRTKAGKDMLAQYTKESGGLARATGSKELTKFAHDQFNEMKEGGEDISKWGTKQGIDAYRRYLGIFDGISKFNAKKLDQSDDWFTSSRFSKEFKRLVSANGYTFADGQLTKNGQAISQEKLNELRNTALTEAKQTTFHDISHAAKLIQEFEDLHPAAGFFTGAIMPFKSTPINMGKRMIEYSPLGLAKSIVKGTSDFHKGNISANEFVNGIAKGLSGTSLFALGTLLSSMGLLRAGGDPDDDWAEKRYKEDVGLHQDYSFVMPIDGVTVNKLLEKGMSDEEIKRFYSVEALNPAITPMLLGARWHEVMGSEGLWDEDADLITNFRRLGINSLDIFGSMIQPLMDMSMMQGIQSLFEDVSYALNSSPEGETDYSNVAGAVMGSLGKTFVSQFLPSIGGAINRTLDPVTRTTYDPMADTAFLRQLVKKIPFAHQFKSAITGNDDYWLQPLINARGEEVTSEGDTVGERFMNNFVNPFSYKTNKSTEADRKLLELYDKTGGDGLIPFNFKTAKLDGTKYTFTPEGRTQVNKDALGDYQKEIKAMIDSGAWDANDPEYLTNLLDKVKYHGTKNAEAEYFNDIGLPGDNLITDQDETVNFLDKKGVHAYQSYDVLSVQNDLNEDGDTIKNSAALRKLLDYDKLGVLEDIRKDIAAHKKDSQYAFKRYGLNKTVLKWTNEQINYEWSLLQDQTATGRRSSLAPEKKAKDEPKPTGKTTDLGGGTGKGTGKKKNTGTSTKKSSGTARRSSGGSSRRSSGRSSRTTTTASTKTTTPDSIKAADKQAKEDANLYEKALKGALKGSTKATTSQIKSSLKSAMKTDQDLYDELVANHKKMLKQLDLWGM